jgi:hypothetical protein
MKAFIKKTALYAFLVFLSLEVFCRVFVDRFYFDAIDIYKSKEANSCLFIGSSRVPATIDKTVFSENNIPCIVAGRGYTTGGIHLTALQHNLQKNPDYLRNVNVFIEYPEMTVFTEDARKYQYYVYEPQTSEFDKPMPHLILPYLNAATLKDFLVQSPNSISVKIKLFFLYSSSAYRCILFLQAKKPVEYVFKRAKNVKDKPALQLTTAGGIRNDHFSNARTKALVLARLDSAKYATGKILTADSLKNSVLAQITSLIKNNGGRLSMYRIPMHSVQRKILLSDRALQNKHVFDQWLQQNNIPVLFAKGFKYTDNDFPDTWHLSVTRRAEFSSLLINELVQQHIIPPTKNSVQQTSPTSKVNNK